MARLDSEAGAFHRSPQTDRQRCDPVLLLLDPAARLMGSNAPGSSKLSLSEAGQPRSDCEGDRERQLDVDAESGDHCPPCPAPRVSRPLHSPRRWNGFYRPARSSWRHSVTHRGNASALFQPLPTDYQPANKDYQPPCQLICQPASNRAQLCVFQPPIPPEVGSPSRAFYPASHTAALALRSCANPLDRTVT